MITVELMCAMCGKPGSSFELTRSDDKPHFDFERDLKRHIKKIRWVYQNNVCGDIYCSKKCAK